jgi:phytoene desaturase
VKIIVVGAGVGGLAAAARLAAAGHRVTVCERNAEPGGKLGWYSRDGFGFDTGPSLLTMPEVFEDLFAATGGPLAGAVELVPLDPIARYRFADGTVVDAAADDEVFAAALEKAFAPGSGADWAALMERARRIWSATRETFLESAIPGPSALARLAVRRPSDITVISPGLTLRALGARYLRDPRARMILDRYATYTGSDPRRAPAALAAVAYAERAFGGWYVAGGLHRLGLAIADRASERGARLLTGCDVVEITSSGGRVDGVRLADGARLAADVVVANVDAERVHASLAPDRRAARAVRRATPSLSGFVMLLALRDRTPPADRAHHRVLFPADYDAEFDAVFGGRLATYPTVYLAAPDDPALAPPGHEAWFVLVNAARHAAGHPPSRPAVATVDWDRPGLAAAYGDRILDVMAQRGVDVRPRLLWRELITPADLERRTGAVGGSIYGTSSNGTRAAFLRPGNAPGSRRGLFLVGGSAHPGGGLPLVATSARIVADLIGPA